MQRGSLPKKTTEDAGGNAATQAQRVGSRQQDAPRTRSNSFFCDDAVTSASAEPLSLSHSPSHSPFAVAGHGRTCAFLVIEIFTCFVLLAALCIEYLIADNIDNNKGQ